MLVFGGSGSPRLTQEICYYLGIPVGKGETMKFSEGTLFVRILENVRGRNVYLVQSTVYPANDYSGNSSSGSTHSSVRVHSQLPS